MIHKQILFLLLFAIPSISMHPEPFLDPCDRYDYDLLMSAYEYEDYYVFDQDIASLNQSLLYACYKPLPSAKEHLERIKYWVEEGASVNTSCGGNFTVLMSSAGGGFADVCKFMIERGASVYTQMTYESYRGGGRYGETALEFAIL